MSLTYSVSKRVDLGLTNGSLSNLRTLDMRENELGDDGADKIAHMMVVEVFSTISVLKLQRYLTSGL